MAVKTKIPTWSFFMLCLAQPHLILARAVQKRAFSISTTVVVSALAAVGGSCAGSDWKTCLVGSIASLVLTILSGFSSGTAGSSGSAITARALTNSTVHHHFPNGSVIPGFYPGSLEVEIPHLVTVGDGFEAHATRLSTGHVRLSAKIDQPLSSGGGSLIRRAAYWAHRNFGTTSIINSKRAGDDDPGDTGYIDVYYNDINTAGTGLTNEGDANTLAQDVGSSVADVIVNDRAETACNEMKDTTDNEVVIATEWYIRANDGSSGSTPSGACDNAQANKMRKSKRA